MRTENYIKTRGKIIMGIWKLNVMTLFIIILLRIIINKIDVHLHLNTRGNNLRTYENTVGLFKQHYDLREM